MNEVIEPVIAMLTDLGIAYELHRHIPVFTIEDVAKTGIPFDGHFCKNLFLRNAKGDVHYLLIIPGSKKSDLKKVAGEIASSRLSFASDERLQRYLKLPAGSVSPFGLVNDERGEVKVLLDRDMIGAPKLHFHPNINTATVTISYDGLMKFLSTRKNAVQHIAV